MVLSMKNKRIIIIGAGPCGLGALWQLKKLGYTNIYLYEQSSHAGGVSSTHVDSKRFIWDSGGHVIGSKNKGFLKEIQKLYTDPLECHVRNAWVHMGRAMVPYPIQYHADGFTRKVHFLSPEISFYHWVIASFGKKIAQSFFLPFNRKLWKYPLTKMSITWIQRKIPQHPKTHTGNKWGANASFYYPSQGGIGSLWNKIADGLRSYISFNKRVIAIDAKNHTLVLSDGSNTTYDVLLSTIPLPHLTKIIKGIAFPGVLVLPYVGVAVVGVGIRGTPPDGLKNCHWMYIPDSKIPYFRVSVYSNYGVGNAPQGTWSLLFETTTDPKTKIDKENFIKTTLAHARLQGLIPNDSKIISTFFHHEPFGYPTPVIGRDTILSKISMLLEKSDIFSLGRFGSWKYEEGNMDDVWMQGLAWAKKRRRFSDIII